MTDTPQTHLTGSGALAQEGSTAIGERGANIAGNVGGDVRTGESYTDIDQRGQHVTTQINVVYQGREIAIPAPAAIAAHRAALRERLARDAQARWGGMALYIQEEGATLPIEASPYQPGRLGPRANLLDTLQAADRLLVLGEPGAGKTVALKRLAWELCNGDALTVPVLVKLFDYTGNVSIRERVWAALRATGCLRLDDLTTMEALLATGPTRYVGLFDGLNEVPPEYRDKVVEELRFWATAHPQHPVILTSRAQDELWRRLRNDVGDAVLVQPIGDEQARGYLAAHLQARGRALYARLDDRLRALARTPLLLWLIKEAGAAGESVPGNRGELYARFVSRMLRRDTDRRMDAELREDLKRAALTTLAYHLSLAQRLTCPREEAIRILAAGGTHLRGASHLDEAAARSLIAACARHGLLAGEDTLWFAPHQTVQEHFAALALRERWQAECAAPALRRWWCGWRRQDVAALAAADWWAEPFVQLAGMLDADADRLAQALARVNPWLAWWCVEEGRGVSDATREAVAARSMKLLHSAQVADRRRAVAALAQMQNERVIAPLFEAAGDEDAEVSSLAVGALLERGDAVRATALRLAQQPEDRLHSGGLAYQIARLRIEQGIELVRIPPGPFLMGSDKARDPKAQDRELPQHTVTLPSYWIGKTPVTVAQFRAFVQASGHKSAIDIALLGQDDHPVCYVTWHDAMAYCRWLSAQSGLTVTLPSEAGWEKAARGADGRLYPWGDEPPDDTRCSFNSWERGKTPVGQYSPRGDSPYGCVDMAGNVWEWTHSLYQPYPYNASDGREDAIKNDLRVLRGGAFLGDGSSSAVPTATTLTPTFTTTTSVFGLV